MKMDFDSPWKRVIERFFPQMMTFILPSVAQEIDWGHPYVFLDKELLSIQKAANVGHLNADKLVKVYTRGGQEACVLIHLEVQNSWQAQFSARIFEYYYRIYDKFKKPLMSLAILTDKHPR